MTRTIALCFLILGCLPILSADVLSHKRELAGQILDSYGAASTFRARYASEIETQLKQLAKKGAPQEEVSEIRQAMLEWFDAEIKWPEIKSRIEDLYAREFTESELEDILAFARTDAGRKYIQKLPDLMVQGSHIGQQYASEHQASLNARIREIMSRYQNKTPKGQSKASGQQPQGVSPGTGGH